MADKTLSYGSAGDEVKRLQKALNNAGYSLEVDGKFGEKTKAAVKSYQKKNGLDVDGIVGVNTWGTLNKQSTTGKYASVDKNTTSQAQTKPQVPKETKRPVYNKSESLISAENSLNEWQNKEPEEFKSKYSDDIESILNSILNRDKFSYNMNADPLYNQYKEQYIKNGKKAMLDTMANATALTGGYGNSYAVSAGNQAYNDYMTDLNDILVELYDKAYSVYSNEENSLYDKLSILYDSENDDYKKYRDTLSDYYDEGKKLSDKVSEISDLDYKYFTEALEAYDKDRKYNYEKYIDELEQQNFYDKLLAAEKEFNQEMAFKKAEAERDQQNKDRSYQLSLIKKSSGGSSSSNASKKTSTKDKVTQYSKFPTTYEQFYKLTGYSGILTETEFGGRAEIKKKYGNYEKYLKEMYYKYG